MFLIRAFTPQVIFTTYIHFKSIINMNFSFYIKKGLCNNYKNPIFVFETLSFKG